MVKMFLVQEREYGETEFSSRLESSSKIVDRIGMDDCYDSELRVFDIGEFGKVEPLKIHGVWHDASDPLYIKLVDTEGNAVITGYGEDH